MITSSLDGKSDCPKVVQPLFCFSSTSLRPSMLAKRLLSCCALAKRSVPFFPAGDDAPENALAGLPSRDIPAQST
jgi:hypothetical protein